MIYGVNLSVIYLYVETHYGTQTVFNSLALSRTTKFLHTHTRCRTPLTHLSQ